MGSTRQANGHSSFSFSFNVDEDVRADEEGLGAMEGDVLVVIGVIEEATLLSVIFFPLVGMKTSLNGSDNLFGLFMQKSSALRAWNPMQNFCSILRFEGDIVVD